MRNHPTAIASAIISGDFIAYPSRRKNTIAAWPIIDFGIIADEPNFLAAAIFDKNLYFFAEFMIGGRRQFYNYWLRCATYRVNGHPRFIFHIEWRTSAFIYVLMEPTIIEDARRIIMIFFII